ncbi:islet cell autoantigen 1 S homeolog isoform X2 [Xenopus laevis]|uniref:Islet cell autoantigen 1 S homeolog isoform X2 n=1 Tax=Xenopus laevis TaxID=8355 RepID=A0A8J1L0I9_XENLA|nr:islet cell autoantigen 1 S homeolog isoform X2 [Xenopus laevis]
MDGHNYHYSREFYDQYAQSQDKSVVNKMQQKYWKTKQTLIKVTGKKEDEHVVASDSDLDAKLELFHSIQRTCMELLKVIEQYQKRICFLSQEENELGKFLRSQGSQDKTRAGKIMQATGKALCFSSQQRLSLRSPLSRLHQEVETFRYRAISDSWLTVNRMEQSRTEYRGVLLWMKDVSQELDPDTYKQMEKFRKVQAQVRHTKAAFDRLKTDVCEKVDLLRASRCNLLSHVLTTYQTTLLHFWEKTSHTMAAIHESFKGYQPYEFTTLKPNNRKPGASPCSADQSLQDPVDKLIKQEEEKEKGKEDPAAKPDDELISLDDMQQTEESGSPGETNKGNISSFDEFLRENSVGALDDLLDLKPEEKMFYEEAVPKDPLDPDAGDKDEMQLLNDILGASSLEGDDLGKEWASVFGDAMPSPHPVSPGAINQEQHSDSSSGFLPSQLLDQDMNDLLSSLQGGWTANSGASSSPAAPPPNSFNSSANKAPAKDVSKTAGSKDLSAWYNLFADLDPLSNPDAVGKTDKEHELLNA